jgi:hypothetical protein
MEGKRGIRKLAAVIRKGFIGKTPGKKRASIGEKEASVTWKKYFSR